MNSSTRNVYRFDNFHFDTDRFALYYKDDLIKEAEKKPLEVLAALLTCPGTLVSYEEMIVAVWPDNLHGATPARINQYVSKLRRIFTAYEPNNQYIENIKGRGYIFNSEIRVNRELVANGKPKTIKKTWEEFHDKYLPERSGIAYRRSRFYRTIFAFVMGFFIGAAEIWYRLPRTKGQDIKE